MRPLRMRASLVWSHLISSAAARSERSREAMAAIIRRRKAAASNKWGGFNFAMEPQVRFSAPSAGRSAARRTFSIGCTGRRQRLPARATTTRGSTDRRYRSPARANKQIRRPLLSAIPTRRLTAISTRRAADRRPGLRAQAKKKKIMVSIGTRCRLSLATGALAERNLLAIEVEHEEANGRR